MSAKYELDEISMATQLINFGLDKRFTYLNNTIYKKILKEYKRSSLFINLCNTIAENLGLIIIRVSEEGVFLSSFNDSHFKKSKQSLKKLYKEGNPKYVSIVILGLASYFFPFDRDFDRPISNTISIPILEEYIYGVCETISRKENVNDADVFQSMAKAFYLLPGRDNESERKQSTRHSIIKATLDFLVDQKLFICQDEQYYPKPSFRYSLENLIDNQYLEEFIQTSQEQKSSA